MNADTKEYSFLRGVLTHVLAICQLKTWQLLRGARRPHVVPLRGGSPHTPTTGVSTLLYMCLPRANPNFGNRPEHK